MPAPATTPEAGTTLYRQVADRLLARIGSGQIGIGDALAPEPALAEEYAVSRHTMREALRILRELGVVDRKPGAGTIVKARGPQPSYIQIIRSPQELLQYPESTLTVHSSQPVRANRALASLLQCRTGERWVQVRALRRLKVKAARKGAGLPICWLDLYLLPEYAGVVPLIGKRSQPVYEMIREMYGQQTTTVSADIGVSRLSDEKAAALGVAAGDPSLRVVRRYVGARREAFQISVSEHPSDRYEFRLQWQCGLSVGPAWTTGRTR